MSCNVTSPACILFYNNFRIATNHHLTNSNMMMIRLPSLIICQTIDRQAGRQAVSTQHNTTHRFLDLYAHLMVYIVGSLSMAGQISLVAKVRHTHTQTHHTPLKPISISIHVLIMDFIFVYFAQRKDKTHDMKYNECKMHNKSSV